jgi:hypothetical protein
MVVLILFFQLYFHLSCSVYFLSMAIFYMFFSKYYVSSNKEHHKWYQNTFVFQYVLILENLF